MEDLIDQIQCRSETDSIAMRVLRSAMDKAHEKLQSSGGPIEFLHDISTFYKLAVILVEAGLNIVQEETDIPHPNSDSIVSDLVELKHWLHRQIQEMKRLIVDKDGELMERLDNNFVEEKDTEYVHLHEKLTESQDVKDGDSLPKTDDTTQKGPPEGTILTLKTSTDQQKGCMKTQVDDEEERMVPNRRTTKYHASSSNFCFKFYDEEKSGSHDFKEDGSSIFERIKLRSKSSTPLKNALVRRMSSDTDYLKETLGLAFGKMKNAKMIPVEKEWRRSIEKVVESVVTKGFISEVRESFTKGESMEEEREKVKEEKVGLEDTYRVHLCGIGEDASGKPLNDLSHNRTDSRKGHCRSFDELESTLNQILLHYLESTIREDLYMLFFRETEKDWKIFTEEWFMKELASDHPTTGCTSSILNGLTFDFSLQESVGSLLKEDIYMVFFREMIKACQLENDFCNELMETQATRQSCIRVQTPRSLNCDTSSLQGSTPRSRKLETDGEDILIQKIDSLSKCLELEEDLMLKASSEIQEHNVNNTLVILNCEETDERDVIKWLITDDESTFTSVSEKLERALKEVHTSKELLVELEQSLEEPEWGESNNQISANNIMRIEEYNQIRPVLAPENILAMFLVQYQDILKNFEHVLHENLKRKFSRLEELKRRTNTLIEPVAFLRTRKLVYKNAFISRSHNLKLAETEVDLLGDEVESLVRLLERIYVELNKNAALVSSYFEVYDILKLIKKEIYNSQLKSQGHEKKSRHSQTMKRTNRSGCTYI